MAITRMPAGTRARLVKLDPQGEVVVTVKEWNLDVDFPELSETTPTERPWMEPEALGEALPEYWRFRIEVFNPTDATIQFNPTASKISIPYRIFNTTIGSTSNRVLTPADLTLSAAAMAAGTTVPLYPKRFESIGEYVVLPKTLFKLGHTTGAGLDKNNDRVLVVAYAGTA